MTMADTLSAYGSTMNRYAKQTGSRTQSRIELAIVRNPSAGLMHTCVCFWDFHLVMWRNLYHAQSAHLLNVTEDSRYQVKLNEVMYVKLKAGYKALLK